jgi:hypothetical protein
MVVGTSFVRFDNLESADICDKTIEFRRIVGRL